MKKHRRTVRGRMRRVADVLRSDWDPIGNQLILDLPADEYDSYAPGVVALLDRGADDRAVAEHLSTLEASAMGLPPREPPRLLDVARKLRAAAAE